MSTKTKLASAAFAPPLRIVEHIVMRGVLDCLSAPHDKILPPDFAVKDYSVFGAEMLGLVLFSSSSGFWPASTPICS